MRLKNGTLGYKNWADIPVPMYMRVKMFNWTNPKDIKSTNYKPHFVEMGPYVFLEKHTRVNVSFHPENDTVSFGQIRTWHFVPEMSNGTMSDNVTNVNVVAAVRFKRSIFHRISNFTNFKWIINIIWHFYFEERIF